MKLPAAPTILIGLLAATVTAEAADRPNILWITCEDISPDLGCYGVPHAHTPNLDRLAAEGVRFTNAFAPIGVCAPARSSLILGMYAPSVGTQHMRCRGNVPDAIRAFPESLRRAGYYGSNNVKTDYNFDASPETWDESSPAAHWRNRDDDQPFFSVFNFTSTHESQIRLPEDQYRARAARLDPGAIHDPAATPIPPFHPDTPEVHRDWARYHDMISFMDGQAGEVLRQLDEDGLADDTIVFFFSDHGAGMPRCKRWLYDSSTRVPLIVRFPPKYADLAPGPPGSTCDRLVDFTDLGPTVLSLAGVAIPDNMQGKSFLGASAAAPRRFVHGFRDRMDERYDMLRSVFDGRYRYIRNYLPQRPWFHDQYIAYMDEMPTMRGWQRLADEGALTGPPAIFMATSKPTEELYDVTSDPFEIRNLADSPEHAETLRALREEHRRWMAEILDLGLLPEADLNTRFGDEPPYSAVRRDPSLYPFDRIAEAADLAGRRDPAGVPELVELLDDPDPAVRWWAAQGLGMLGARAADAEAAVRAAMIVDQAAWVRVAAADALAALGHPDAAAPALATALADPNPWVRLESTNALDRLDAAASPVRATVERARDDENPYVAQVAKHALEDIGGEDEPQRPQRTQRRKKENAKK